MNAYPEHGKAVQAEENGEIINDGNVEVAAIGPEVSLVINTESLEKDREYS